MKNKSENPFTDYDLIIGINLTYVELFLNGTFDYFPIAQVYECLMFVLYQNGYSKSLAVVQFEPQIISFTWLEYKSIFQFSSTNAIHFSNKQLTKLFCSLFEINFNGIRTIRLTTPSIDKLHLLYIENFDEDGMQDHSIIQVASLGRKNESFQIQNINLRYLILNKLGKVNDNSITESAINGFYYIFWKLSNEFCFNQQENDISILFYTHELLAFFDSEISLKNCHIRQLMLLDSISLDLKKIGLSRVFFERAFIKVVINKKEFEKIYKLKKINKFHNSRLLIGVNETYISQLINGNVKNDLQIFTAYESLLYLFYEKSLIKSKYLIRLKSQKISFLWCQFKDVFEGCCTHPYHLSNKELTDIFYSFFETLPFNNIRRDNTFLTTPVLDRLNLTFIEKYDSRGIHDTSNIEISIIGPKRDSLKKMYSYQAYTINLRNLLLNKINMHTQKNLSEMELGGFMLMYFKINHMCSLNKKQSIEVSWSISEIRTIFSIVSWKNDALEMSKTLGDDIEKEEFLHFVLMGLESFSIGHVSYSREPIRIFVERNKFNLLNDSKI